MSSKGKKSKKKVKPLCDGTKSKDSLTNKKIYSYFSAENIAEAKSILKIKDVNCVPFVIAATVLYKLDLLKRLLKDGYNINQTGQNNMTALIWAVKYKYLDIVDYLLSNGADPTMKTDSGDNILIIALEHKLWDEQSFISLWRSIKKISFIDVNFTNKNGHNMLHMCVRRDWEELLKILIFENPNIDSANLNGVTPLMLACFRNNSNIINTLIEAGADILKEDNHGRTTICYAISASLKALKPPFETTDKILTEIKKRHSIESYLKRRMKLILATANKSEISCAASETYIKIVQFFVQYNDGVHLLLKFDIFSDFLTVIEIRWDNPEIIKFLLEILTELLFYNEQSSGFKQELLTRIQSDFFKTGFAETCLKLFAKKIVELSKIAFNLLVLAYNNEEDWFSLFAEFSSTMIEFLNETQTPVLMDENRVKILRNKKKKLKKAFDEADISTCQVSRTPSAEETKKPSENGGSSDSKRSRRRSKAIKAKMTKMKSAELTKRLNLNGKKLNQKGFKTPSPGLRIEDQVEVERDFIVASFQHLIDKVEVKKEIAEETGPKWKKTVLRLPFLDFEGVPRVVPVDYDKLGEAVEFLRKCKRFDGNTQKFLNIVVEYLRQLVQMLVAKYKEHWEADRIAGCCRCPDINEHVPWYYTRHLKEIETRERETVQDLHKSFEHLAKNLVDLAKKSIPETVKQLSKIESSILNYEIRGIKLVTYVSNYESVLLRFSTDNSTFHRDPNLVVQHVQNVLNNLEEPRTDLDIEIDDGGEDFNSKSESPLEVYHREMAAIAGPQPRNKRKEIEAKLNTIANGFHLINATMAICDDVDNSLNRIYGIADLNHSFRPKSNKASYYPEITEYMPKRLKTQISSLQNSKIFQELLGGEIRIATKEQRVNYIISAGINFNAVELGLDLNNRPLAVKKIQRESWVGKVMKTLIEPLLGLTDNHILPYFACEYEGNELILATPLCKWNLSQYVQILRNSDATEAPSLTAVQIVKQFLDGLMVLHKCEVPIVHGNLKPANIFIDFDGLVKIAEFGIHKAFYKIIEAPKSSLIWFAKETLDIYRTNSMVECSLKSDVQVAGMMIYFVLSYGKHPYGEDIDEILRNIQRGISKLNVRNLDLRDLLLWMMLNDSDGRPTVTQVISHPFFWSAEKKWSFILCCSGINQTGYNLPINIDKLHRSIDSFSDTYITINWQETIKNKFPNSRINELPTVGGLLKHIKYSYDQLEPDASDTELSCAILSLFPSLPVALYRTLQNTNWLKHAVFTPFSLAASTVF